MICIVVVAYVTTVLCGVAAFVTAWALPAKLQWVTAGLALLAPTMPALWCARYASYSAFFWLGSPIPTAIFFTPIGLSMLALLSIGVRWLLRVARTGAGTVP